jgi:hypothetical protein
VQPDESVYVDFDYQPGGEQDGPAWQVASDDDGAVEIEPPAAQDESGFEFMGDQETGSGEDPTAADSEFQFAGPHTDHEDSDSGLRADPGKELDAGKLNRGKGVELEFDSGDTMRLSPGGQVALESPGGGTFVTHVHPDSDMEVEMASGRSLTVERDGAEFDIDWYSGEGDDWAADDAVGFDDADEMEWGDPGSNGDSGTDSDGPDLTGDEDVQWGTPDPTSDDQMRWGGSDSDDDDDGTADWL